MIDFELTPEEQAMIDAAHKEALEVVRPISRYYDEHEHESPKDFIEQQWQQQAQGGGSILGLGVGASLRILENCWGDAGLMLVAPSSGLGGAAILASGTQEQQANFLKRFGEGEPKWGAMAMTEPGAGSDTAAIQTTAVLDTETNEWVLNGEKIFITGGQRSMESDGLVVVWATVDRTAGRAGMKPFVVEAGTPGATIDKVENKLGIRASDTATLILDNCRIPYENILGSPEVRRVDSSQTAGFKRAMATFDMTRPIIAAMALGVGRASLDFVRETLEKEGIPIRYGLPSHKLTAIERDVMEMEAAYKAALTLMLRATWMMSQFQPNSLEASMAKAKAGIVVAWITQKAVEMMGPLGYSRKYLLEKWMRDGKINDIFEGTGQINMLIVARRILDYTREELK
ncbi:MAG TPA: acyl-CoA dehydrogenase [Dehalococcoidia bacterium]|nr:acyl-CoA dehydrogenase [Dehalococcoidia bacterium]